MREILFRGKRVNNGEWVYGDLRQYKNNPDSVDFYQIDTMSTSDKDFGSGYTVIPETIGQYTGLFDKNGNKIFEGDILKGELYPYKNDSGEYNYFAEVCWWDNCPAFGLYVHKNPKSTVVGISDGNTEDMENWESEQWEVIGNIYDNPELLK